MGAWKTCCMQHKVRLLKEISALYKDCLRLQVLPAVSPVTVSLGYLHHGSCSIEIWLQFPPFSSPWVSQRDKALPKLFPLHKHLSLVCTSFTTDELSRGVMENYAKSQIGHCLHICIFLHVGAEML